MMSETNSTKRLAICESVHGNWHYHLFNRKTGKDSKALCGAQTMWSGATLDSWGFKPDHMPSSYCKECERISQANLKLNHK